MYDVAIIGTGPAGISCALTLQARNKNFVLFGSKNLSENGRKAEKILNYPGLSKVSGKELMDAFSKQLDELGIEITEKMVTGIFPDGDHFSILCNDEVFDAKKVVLATGVSAKTIPGEAEFLGRGLSYCATCDGFLYKEKTIAVLCFSKSFEEEVKYLASIARKIYLIPLYKDVDLSLDNIEIIKEKPVAIEGAVKANTLVTGSRKLSVDGIFMLKDSFSPSVLLNGIKLIDGHIEVDREMRTSVEGCFAAGDCTGRPYQYAKAVGEGNVAALAAISGS